MAAARNNSKNSKINILQSIWNKNPPKTPMNLGLDVFGVAEQTCKGIVFTCKATDLEKQKLPFAQVARTTKYHF
jgi:hypothetical protein